jgi:hypothetical protein
MMKTVKYILSIGGATSENSATNNYEGYQEVKTKSVLKLNKVICNKKYQQKLRNHNLQMQTDATKWTSYVLTENKGDLRKVYVKWKGKSL